MKGVDMLCVSQASTAICEEGGSSSAVHLGGRAIDRHNPIICDGRRSSAPINPKPYHQLHNKPKKKGSSNNNKKSTDETRKPESQAVKTASLISSSSSSSIVSRVIKKVGADLVTPPGSSRYLLGEASFVDGDPVLAIPNKKSHLLSTDSSSPTSNQVVVLRVSLHCKGCEGKVRKHLSRMQGVRSFNIDFAAKKVTVVGDVSPVSVLASISKVKNAQILTNN